MCNACRCRLPPGDAEKRKAQLREMFAEKYKDLAAVAAKLPATLASC